MKFQRERKEFSLKLNKRQVTFLVIGINSLFLLVFALGIMVGRGLYEEETTSLSSSEQEKGTVADFSFKKKELEKEGTALDKLETSEPEFPFYDNPSQKKDITSPPVASKEPFPSSELARGKEDKKPEKKSLYTIQVGAFRDKEEAEGFMAELKKKKYPVYLVKSAIPSKGTLYRVRIGQFSTKEEAKKFAAQIKTKEKLSIYVTSMSP